MNSYRVLRMPRLALLMLFALYVALALSGADSAIGAVPPQIPPDAGNLSSFSVKDRLVPARPWTAEEMAQAVPYPLEHSATPQRTHATLDKLTRGKAGAVAGGLPKDMQVEMDAAPVAPFMPSSPAGYTYPAPFTRYENFSNYTIYPYRTVGKLFFRQYGVSYVCSAASIGNFGVFTAGHCVHAGDGSEWSSNMVFVPAYKNGSAPYGQWPASYLWVKTAWAESGDFRYDMGGIILRKQNGYKISQVVGWLGFAWNWSDEQHWFLFGYPQGYPFNGKRQQVCASSYAYSDTSSGVPYPTGVGCDQTGGSSGGPWILQFSGNAGATNYLNGVNSYGYNSLEMYSPYFGDDAKSLWDCIINSTPTTAKCE